VTARKIRAWGVHAYTALGLILAAGAAVLIVQGGEEHLRQALLLLWVAGAVDCTDGWLARRFAVREELPGFDGRRLDDLIDFHTYVSLPLLLLWRAGIPGEGLAWVLLLPLLGSGYGFSQLHAKTEDGFFRGFPSYWNVVAFYLFFLAPGPWLSFAILVGLTGLVFVPTPYLHPSRGGPLPRLTVALGAVWALIVLAILLDLPAWKEGWLLVSLLYPAYYLGVSWLLIPRMRGTSSSQVGSTEDHGAERSDGTW